MKKSKYTPYDCFENIYLIDYDKLSLDNKKVIIFDLDNTIMPYHIKRPTQKIIDFMQSLKDKGFIVILLSNSPKKRIEVIGELLGIDYFYRAMKPFKKGYKEVLSKYKDYKKDEFVCIGDQLITDVFGARRVGIDCILVKPIFLDNEHWYTKINRMNERRIIKKFRNTNPVVYTKIYNIRGDIKN